MSFVLRKAANGGQKPPPTAISSPQTRSSSTVFVRGNDVVAADFRTTGAFIFPSREKTRKGGKSAPDLPWRSALFSLITT